MSDATDAALLAATAAGDAAAFAQVLGRHEHAVLRYARLLVRHAADAEDVAQNAFVAAWRGAAGFRGDDSARAWLLAITRREALRLRRGVRDEPVEPETLEQLADAAGWGNPEPAPAADDLDRLAAALAALAAADREVLLLRDVEGLLPEAAAEQLGIGVAAFKSRLHRARLKLARAVRRGDG